jgi:phenylacetate-CoA ligase
MADSSDHGNPTQQAVLDAFRAAFRSPHYADLMAQARIDPGQVSSLADFARQVPIIRKEQLFAGTIPFARLCGGGAIGSVRSVMISSGFGNCNTFAVASRDEVRETIDATDDALDRTFGTGHTPTLLINALAMGIHFPTRHTLAEPGPRSDSVLRILEHFGPYFEQIIIVADPHLLKDVVDEGRHADIDWRRRNVSFVAGGDWMPETLRSYIHAQTGITDDGHRVLIQTMGLTELGLNILLESRETIRLRRIAGADSRLRAALFPGTGAAVPSLFHYDPRRFHIESVPHPGGRELVVTSLITRTVPMVRYATGDLGDVLSPQALAATLATCGHETLQPSLPLPCAWVAGRASTSGLRAETLRHGLYSDPIVAQAVTGHFTVYTPAGSPRAAVQLRRGTTPSAALRAATQRALFSVAATDLPTDIYSYDDYPFGKTLDHERKFSHLH